MTKTADRDASQIFCPSQLSMTYLRVFSLRGAKRCVHLVVLLGCCGLVRVGGACTLVRLWWIRLAWAVVVVGRVRLVGVRRLVIAVGVGWVRVDRRRALWHWVTRAVASTAVRVPSRLGAVPRVIWRHLPPQFINCKFSKTFLIVQNLIFIKVLHTVRKSVESGKIFKNKRVFGFFAPLFWLATDSADWSSYQTRYKNCVQILFTQISWRLTIYFNLVNTWPKWRF